MLRTVLPFLSKTRAALVKTTSGAINVPPPDPTKGSERVMLNLVKYGYLVGSATEPPMIAETTRAPPIRRASEMVWKRLNVIIFALIISCMLVNLLSLAWKVIGLLSLSQNKVINSTVLSHFKDLDTFLILILSTREGIPQRISISET